MESHDSVSLQEGSDEAVLIEEGTGARDINGSETPEQLRTLAENAFRQREYGLTVKYFEALAEKNAPSRYNDVAMSKHGAALWRFAVSTPGLAKQERIDKISSSLRLLEQAARHVDPRYQARALYEMSKASYHLWKLTSDCPELESARKSAEKAAKTDYETAYISWLERVEEEIAQQPRREEVELRCDDA